MPLPPAAVRTVRTVRAVRPVGLAVLALVVALGGLTFIGPAPASALGTIAPLRSIESSANPAYLDALPTITVKVGAPAPGMPVPTSTVYFYFYKGDSSQQWGGTQLDLVDGAVSLPLPAYVLDAVVDGRIYIDVRYLGDATYAPFTMFHYAQALVPRPTGPSIRIDRGPTDLGAFITGAPTTRTLTVTNISDGPLHISAGTTANGWLTLPDDACPGDTPVLGTCRVTLTVNPRTTGSLAADVTITAGWDLQTVRYTATASTFTPPMTNPEVPDFVVALGTTSAIVPRVYGITLPGVAVSAISTTASDGLGPVGTTCGPAQATGTCTVTVTLGGALGVWPFELVFDFASGQQVRVAQSFWLRLEPIIDLSVSANPVPETGGAVVTETIRSDRPGAPTAAGTVRFRIDDGTAFPDREVPVVDGRASLVLPPLPPGMHQVRTAHFGDVRISAGPDPSSEARRAIDVTVEAVRFGATAEPSDLGLVATSTVRRVTVRNTGNVPIMLVDPNAAGADHPYRIVSTTCVAAVAPGDACSIGLSAFTPLGPIAFDLPFFASGQPVPVHMTATVGAASAVAAPATLTLPLARSGTRSNASTKVTFGATVGAMDAPTIAPTDAPFAATFDPSTGSLNVTFAPVAAGPATGEVRMRLTDGSTLVVPVSGRAIPTASITVPAADFGPLAVGYAADTAIVVSNNGADAVSLVAGVFDGPIAITSSTCTALPAHGTCTVVVHTIPTQPGTFAGKVTLSDELGPVAITTVTGRADVLVVSVGNAGFGAATLGAPAVRNVVITNRGGAPARVLGVTSSRPEFTVMNLGTCTGTLSPTRTCTLPVRFVPTAVGPVTASLDVTLAQGGVVSGSLSGSGVRRLPVISVVTPARGPRAGGTVVVVRGHELAAATTVRFGAVTVPATCTATQCVAVSPAGRGTVDITVTTPSGTSVNRGVRFRYV